MGGDVLVLKLCVD